MGTRSGHADEETGTSNGVGKLLDAPAYEQSAEDRQVALLEMIRRLHVEVETRQRDQMRLVEEAQRQGASWSKIGDAQNVSAQAAQQRFKRWKAQPSDTSAPARKDAPK